MENLERESGSGHEGGSRVHRSQLPTVVEDLDELLRSLRIVGPFLADGLACRHADGRVLYVSPTIERATGLSLEEYASRPTRMLVIEEDAALLDDLREEVVARLGDAPIAEPAALKLVRFTRPDGRVRTVEVAASLVHDTQGRLLAVLTVMRDVTPRIEREHLATLTTTAVRELLDVLPIGVVLRGADGTFVFANRPAERIVGCAPGWLVSRTVFDMVHPDDHLFLRDRMHQETGTDGGTSEMRIRTLDGRVRWIRTAYAEAFYEGTQAAVLALEDITEQKEELAGAASELHDQVLQPAVATNIHIALAAGSIGEADPDSARIASAMMTAVVENVSRLLARIEATLVNRTHSAPDT